MFHALVLALIAAYSLIRIGLLGSLSGDEAEQVLFAQSFSWGYAVTNPPLYTWLVIGAFALLGKSGALIIALKFAILGLVYVALYHTAVLALGRERRWEAALVGLSPLLLFFMSWQAVFSFSHALLLALFVTLTFLALLRVTATGHTHWYAVLGLVIGLGVMSKYSYLLFLFGLFAAGLTIRDVRARLLNWRMLAAFGLAALVLLPHGLWLLDNFDHLLARTEYKLQIDESLPYAEGVLKGLWNLLRAAVGFLSPFWLVGFALFPWALKPRPIHDTRSMASAWLGRAYLIVVAAMLGMVLFGGITQFRPNYMLFFVLAPLWLIARLPLDERTDKRLVYYGRAIAVFGTLSVAILLGKALYDPSRCTKCQSYVPYDKIARALQDAGFTKGTIFAHWYPHPLPGNLALYLDDARIISQKFPNLRPPRHPEKGQCLLVWVPEEQGGPNTEGYFVNAAYALGIPLKTRYTVRHLKLPLDHAPDKFVLVDFVLWKRGRGDCF